MNIEKMREEFEAWALKEFGLTPGHLIKDPEENNEYGNYPTQCYWEVWQASRAALAVEMPLLENFKEDESAYYMLVVCRDAIKASGLKVSQ